MPGPKITIDKGDRPTSETEQPEQFRVVDKRHVADAGSAAPEAAEEKPRYPSYVEELLARCEEAERRYKERRKAMDDEAARLRARLEADYRRRLELERRDLLLPFLDVLDNLERSIASAASGADVEKLLAGVEMTAALFRARLKSAGIEPMSVVGEPFDPNRSEAVGLVEVRDPKLDGVVVEELARGYTIGAELLRPARVRVGKLG